MGPNWPGLGAKLTSQLGARKVRYPNSHPSAASDIAESCARLKAKLQEEMAELEMAIEFGGR